MKTRFFFILWLSSVTVSLLAADHTTFVNPFIGTQTDATGALSGSTFPGATMPQGMVQLSPETEHMVTWDPCSGYDYNRDSIYGFTHTHLSGTGCTDLIDVSLMPLSHEVRTAELRKGVFGQRYSHQAEAARPGYYMVDLQESGVRVELSATVRTGIHRYTFPQGAPQTVVLDLDRGTYRGEAYYTGRRAYQIIQSQLRVVDDHTIEGFRVITGWAKLRKVYFRAEFSRPFSRRLLMDGARSVGESPVVNGRSLRGALSFDPADGALYSADGFGKFGALSKCGFYGRDDDDWACEARRYYFNIVGKYGPQVQQVLKKAAGLPIKTIRPLHGPILEDNLGEYISLYDTWSRYEPETDGIFIAVASIHGGTMEAAEMLAQILAKKGAPKVVLSDLCRSDIAENVEDAFRYPKIILAAASYDAGLFSPMYDFIHRLQIKGWTKRKAGLVENGSWAPSAGRVMREMLSQMKDVEIVEPLVTIRSRMKRGDFEALDALADAILV